MHHAQQQQASISNTDQNKKYNILFENLMEIGNSYNGVCTSYGKCIHKVGNNLLLHRATAARMTNQIKFILNHITTHPEYMDGTGLFEAFQENQAKWAEVEAGKFDKYTRGEGTLLPRTQQLKWARDQNLCKGSQDEDLDNSYHQQTNSPKTTSNLKQPPETIAQTQNYQTPKREKKRAINITHITGPRN